MSNEFNDIIDMGLSDPQITPWDGKSNPMLDPGEYIFEVTKVNQSQARSGNPTLVIHFKVVSDGPANGREMRQSYSLASDKEGTRRRMRNLVDALGVPLGEGGVFSAQSLVGCQMMGEVIDNEWTENDPRTGQVATRMNRKIVGERAVPGAIPPQAQAQAPVQQAPKNAPVVARRGGPNNQQPAAPQVRRS